MPFINFNAETDHVVLSTTTTSSRNNLMNEDQIIMESVNYFLKTFSYPDISRKIVEAFNYWIQAPEDKFEENHELMKIETVGHMLTQDIGEDRKLRQGKPTTHMVCGVSHAITGSMLALIAPGWVKKSYMYKTAQVRPPHLIRLQRAKNLFMELKQRAICPTEQMYYEICGTRGLLMLLLLEIDSLQELYGINKIDFTKLACNVRTFLTITDECRRLVIKDIGDIEAGHFSFPLVYSINEKKDGGDLILDILRQRTKQEVVLKHALSVVKESDCFEYAKKKLYLLKQDILQEYEKFDKNPLMENLFNDYLQIPDNFEDITWELS